MGTFYCIAKKLQHKEGNSAYLLQKAAEAQGVPFVTILVEECDHLSLPTVGVGDMLYRTASGSQASVIEALLIQPDVATFYRDTTYAMRPAGPLMDPLMLVKAGVPIIPTIFTAPTDRTQLNACVEHLGGVPIIIKEMGGSHGVGVMKIDSIESLFSVVDVLRAKGSNYILRKYIDYETHFRLIVIGREVAGVAEYPRITQDFRSNVGSDINLCVRDCSEEFKKIAIAAVQAKGLEFGGVDLLVDHKDNPYVAEVNFPCFFPRVQHATGIDIAGNMVTYLQNKATQ